jgi:hypothetical protein
MGHTLNKKRKYSTSCFFCKNVTFTKVFNAVVQWNSTFLCNTKTGSAKASGREPKTGLGRVYNSKLGCIATLGNKCMVCMQPHLKL